MRFAKKHLEAIFLGLVVLILVGLPLGIMAYDHYLWPRKVPEGAKEFTLTGNAQYGWMLGEVQAYDMIALWQKNGSLRKPVIKVNQGDLVVLKLRSSDVTHGFSLKAYGIYLADGILPGKTVFVNFRADKAGTFLFTCNVFCGDVHPHMQGTLVVKPSLS